MLEPEIVMNGTTAPLVFVTSYVSIVKQVLGSKLVEGGVTDTVGFASKS